MTVAQFFVEKRSVAWMALAGTIVWGVFGYLRMPQRHDPVIPIRSGIILTRYPGATAEKVEQELTRKIEKRVSEHPSVETVTSLSRQGLSVVHVDLSDRERDAETTWQDIRGKLATVPDLPEVGDAPVRPYLDKDFADTVAVMLTLSSPPVSDLEIELRAKTIKDALERVRAARPPELRHDRASGCVVYPSTVARASVLRMGNAFLRDLSELGLIRDGRIVEGPGMAAADFQVLCRMAELQAAIRKWEEGTVGEDKHHDVWPPFFVQDLDSIPGELRKVARDKYTFRELKRFADLIQDRLKRSPNVGKVEQIGTQNERITLLFSGQRFEQVGISPSDIRQRLLQRNINVPGGRFDLKEQTIVVQPSGEFRSEQEIGEVVVAVSADGYPMYLRDLVEIERGYEDPPGVLNLRSVPREVTEGAAGRGVETSRAVTLSIRQIAGSHIADFSRDVEAALEELKDVLPEDLRVTRTSDEPSEVRHKVADFERNLLEAIVIVVLVALLFMEWRSALLVAASIPLTVAMTLGMCQMVGIDLQQISIAALIIALGLLVDDPVVAADAINRELAAGTPRLTAAWLGPQKLARAILYPTVTNMAAFLPLLTITGKTGDFTIRCRSWCRPRSSAAASSR